MSEETTVDTCAEWGSTERWATVWFICAVAIGASLVYVLSRVDKQFYENEGVYLDQTKYYLNRAAQTSIPSEAVDARVSSALVTTDLAHGE